MANICCLECGSTFIIYPYRLPTAKFCSKACSSRWNGRERAEADKERFTAMMHAGHEAQSLIHRDTLQKLCLDCGKPIGRVSWRCKRCAGAARMATEKARFHVGAITKANWQRLDFRAALIASLTGREGLKDAANPNWKGGTRGSTARRIRNSRWVRFSRALRHRRGERCELCGVGPRGIAVHHKQPVRDYPTGEYLEDNCLVLCSSCHGKADNPRSLIRQ